MVLKMGVYSFGNSNSNCPSQIRQCFKGLPRARRDQQEALIQSLPCLIPSGVITVNRKKHKVTSQSSQSCVVLLHKASTEMKLFLAEFTFQPFHLTSFWTTYLFFQVWWIILPLSAWRWCLLLPALFRGFLVVWFHSSLFNAFKKCPFLSLSQSSLAQW